MTIHASVPERDQQRQTLPQAGQMLEAKQLGVQLQSQADARHKHETRQADAPGREVEQTHGERADEDAPPGDPTPEYDQYEVNSPQNMPFDESSEQQRREQAEGQQDRGLGYGASDSEEMADAPDVTAPTEDENEAEERGYGGAGEERVEKLRDN